MFCKRYSVNGFSGIDIPKGYQHKGPLEHTGMGNCEGRGLYGFIAIKQNIEINGPGSPMDSPLPFKGLFDFLEDLQQRKGI
jgi:hypothetical protein